MNDYGARREALEAIIEADGMLEMGDDVGRFDPNVLQRFPIQVSRIRARARSLAQIAREGFPHSQGIAETIGPKLKEHLDDARFNISLRRRQP